MLFIPNIQIKKVIEYLLQTVYNDYYYINQCYIFGNIDLSNGFDWQTAPQSFNLNGTDVLINTNTTNISEVVTALNLALKTANFTTIIFAVYNTKYLVLKTITTSKAVQTITLSNPITGTSIFDTIGIYADTYTGFDETHCIAYRYFGDLNYDRYEYYNEIIKLLKDTFTTKTTESTKKREIKIRSNWNNNPDNRPPVLVISLANEDETAKALGQQTDTYLNDNVQLKKKYYHAHFKITIFSDSKNEVEVLYFLLKALLKGNSTVCNYYGLENLTVSGGDNFAEIESPNTYSQSLIIRFMYSSDAIIDIDRLNRNTAINFDTNKTL